MKKVYLQPTMRLGNINDSLLAGSFLDPLGEPNDGQSGDKALSREGNYDFEEE